MIHTSTTKIKIIITASVILLLCGIMTISMFEESKRFTYGPEVLKEKIGLLLPQETAEELSNQIEVVTRSVKDRPYVVVDFSGPILFYLVSLVNNHYCQIYHETHPGCFNQESTDAFISQLKDVPFVIVNSEVLPKNKYEKQIQKYLGDNFHVVDAYFSPKEKTKDTQMIYSFYVMEKK